jgi:hypothetical protein
VALPLATSTLVATLAYGTGPDFGAVARFGFVLLGVPAFFIALNLAVATRLNSQAGIAAIAFAIFGLPYLFGGFFPVLVEFWPTSIGAMAGAVAMGEAPQLATVAGWALALGGLGAASLVSLGREDL